MRRAADTEGVERVQFHRAHLGSRFAWKQTIISVSLWPDREVRWAGAMDPRGPSQRLVSGSNAALADFADRHLNSGSQPHSLRSSTGTTLPRRPVLRCCRSSRGRLGDEIFGGARSTPFGLRSIQ